MGFKDRNFGKRESFGKRDSGRRSGGDRFGAGRRASDRDSGFKEKFKVKCDKCGKSCEVPFKPSGQKPVYCSDCFRTTSKPAFRRSDDDNSYSPSANVNSPSPAAVTRKDIEEINEKLDAIMESLGL